LPEHKYTKNVADGKVATLAESQLTAQAELPQARMARLTFRGRLIRLPADHLVNHRHEFQRNGEDNRGILLRGNRDQRLQITELE
jgi:hypothetical protein